MISKNYLLGGGITAASFCHFAKDFENVIIEKEPRLNGRIKSYPINNNSVEIGAQFFCKEDKNIYDLVKSLDFKNDLQHINLQNFSVFHDNRITKLKNKISPEFSSKEITELKKFYSFLERDALKVFETAPEELFSIHFDKWYNEKFGENSNWLIMGLVRAITFSEPKDLTAFYGLLVSSTFFEPCFTIRGGMELLNDRLLSLSKPRIMNNNKVTALSIDDSNISTIELNNEKQINIGENDNVISTIPSIELANIIPNSSLKKHLKKIRYGSCGVTLIKTKKKLLGHDSGILCTTSKGISIIIDENKYLGFESKEGYIGILTPYKKGQKDVYKNTIQEASEIIPNLENNIENSEYFEWDYGLPIASSELFELQPNITDYNIDNFYICGDFMGMPSLDACIESSQLVAKNIISKRRPDL